MSSIDKALDQLNKQLVQIKQAIASLEALRNASGVKAKATKRVMSDKARKAISDAQKKRWKKFHASKKQTVAAVV